MRTLSFDLAKQFAQGPIVRAALEVSIERHPVTVLFGPSGSGKTTVLRCLAGLDKPDTGHIELGGESWFDSTTRRFVPPQERSVGLLFQDLALFPHLTVEENIGYGLRRLERAERKERVRELAHLLRIEDLLLRSISQISGGQRQRAALARALAPQPRLLLLDEPFSALDEPTRQQLRSELRLVLERSGIPSLVVTHDRIEALALGDQMAVLAEGQVRQVGPVHEVFSAPADLVVARVVGTENVSPARIIERRQGLALIELGTVKAWAIDPGHLDGVGYACIRAEDVLLERQATTVTSARNEFPGLVLSISEEGPLVRVALDCGFRLVSLVTRESAERLSIAPGHRIAALVKAQAIRVVPRST
ncbi:MAG TPA: ABC transporter ATP-binding protein [Anaeromyxobacteraceae bacterium]|nr:ABC transporter ATP-binding protein [Anaeromyxobacteraceae bacterium]